MRTHVLLGARAGARRRRAAPGGVRWCAGWCQEASGGAEWCHSASCGAMGWRKRCHARAEADFRNGPPALEPKAAEIKRSGLTDALDGLTGRG